MAAIEAIYQQGVFKPLEEVSLTENQRVRLHVQPLRCDDIQSWLERIRQRQEEIQARRGFFADSAHEIAEDRRR